MNESNFEAMIFMKRKENGKTRYVDFEKERKYVSIHATEI